MQAAFIPDMCALCRRKLRADVAAVFPTLGTDQVSELVPGKEELNIVKLYAHRGDAVTVYVSGGNPILFELGKNLYPTGMAVAWRCPYCGLCLILVSPCFFH